MLERLKLIDEQYFAEYHNVSKEDLISTLATYLFDTDISSGLEEIHWDLLCKIRDEFGDFVALEVIKALCYGEHDT